MRLSSQSGVNIFVTVHYEESHGGGNDGYVERAAEVGQMVRTEENSLVPRHVLCAISNHSVLWHDIESCEMAILSHVMASPSINFNTAG
jgi:hypothetical protein